MKVILTTDGSVAAEKAIRWFSQLHFRQTNSLQIVTVGSYQAYNESVVEAYNEYYVLARKNAMDAFIRAEAILKESGYTAVHVDRMGQAADVITQYAKDNNADLIVLGGHGASLLARIVLGSTSDAVASYAPCSVLVVRGVDTKKPQEKPLNVALAFDGSDGARDAMDQLCAFGLPNDTNIHLISVAEYSKQLDPSIHFELKQAMTEVLQGFAKELNPHFSNIEQHILEDTHVGNALVEFLDQNKIDLLVVGNKGRSAINRFFMGSVSRFVLHHAKCPVLMTRPKAK